MKSLLVAIILSSSAFAVEVRNCPKAVSTKVQNIQLTKTADQVFKELENGWGADAEEAKEIRETFANVKRNRTVIRSFALSSARNGRCQYRGQGEEKVEIYTTQGKSILYVQTNAGPRGILLRTYANIAALSPSRISLTAGKAGSGLAIPRTPYDSFSAGGNLIFVGKSDLAVVAK